MESVYKVIEIVGTSGESWEKAAMSAVEEKTTSPELKTTRPPLRSTICNSSPPPSLFAR